MWYYFYSEIFKNPSELSSEFKQAREWCKNNTTRTFSLVSLSLCSFSPTKKINLYDTPAEIRDFVQSINGSYTLRCKFRSKRDAALFKLFFNDTFSSSKCPKLTDYTYTKVILPIIRRVMPQLLANEIIGVQSMTAPHASIATLRMRYAESVHEDQKNNI